MQLSAQQYLSIISALKGDGENPKERRAQPRVGLHSRVVIHHTDAADQSMHESVTVRDLSRGGLGMSTRTAMTPGQLFVASLPAGEKPLRLIYRVRRCEQVRGTWSVGAVLVGYERKNNAA